MPPPDEAVCAAAAVGRSGRDPGADGQTDGGEREAAARECPHARLAAAALLVAN